MFRVRSAVSHTCQVLLAVGAQDGGGAGGHDFPATGVCGHLFVAMASLLDFLPRRNWSTDPPRGSMARVQTLSASHSQLLLSAVNHKSKGQGGGDRESSRGRSRGRSSTRRGGLMGGTMGHGQRQRGHLPLQPAGMDAGEGNQEETPAIFAFGTGPVEIFGGSLLTEGDAGYGGDGFSPFNGGRHTGNIFTAAEGKGDGLEGHDVASHEEAQLEGQLAALSEGKTKANRSGPWFIGTKEDEESADETAKEVAQEAENFEFPPSPPGIKGEGEEVHSGSLVHLVKRRRRGGEGEAWSKKARRDSDPAEEKPEGEKGDRGGARVRREGWSESKAATRLRPDIPQRPTANSNLKGNQKWLKAIRTAKMFRSSSSRRTRTVSNFQKGYYANSSRRARASVRRTVDKILFNLGVKGGTTCWSPETLEQVGAVLKSSEYKAGVTYLSEYKIMAIEAGASWTQQLQRAYAQATRALNRAKGPAKKAKEVEENTWFEACKAELNETQKGTVHYPALLFAFATTWMLREVELAAIHKEDIVLEEKEHLVSLTLRITKGDQEAKGLKRTLQCSCKGECDWQKPCPYKITKTTLDNVPIESDKLVFGDNEGEVSKDQLIGAWRKCFGKGISGHSGRRSGALQYIRKGWQVPQVAYLGRWKSNVILQYAEEALETMPVMPRPQIEINNKNDTEADTKVPTTPVLKEQDIKALTELKDTERKLKKEIQFLRATQDKLDESILKWERVSKENHGLLPPTVISRGGMVHENKRQPIASPVMAWHTRCGWPFGASAFSFGLDVTMVSCQKCLLLAQSNEERCGKGGG